MKKIRKFTKKQASKFEADLNELLIQKGFTYLPYSGVVIKEEGGITCDVTVHSSSSSLGIRIFDDKGENYFIRSHLDVEIKLSKNIKKEKLVKIILKKIRLVD